MSYHFPYHSSSSTDSSSMTRYRLAQQDYKNIDSYDAGQYIVNPNSYHYKDILTHIPLQRQSHQQASYCYRTNQMIKHAYEDGNHGLTLTQMNKHTSLMNDMSDREAFLYAKKQGW